MTFAGLARQAKLQADESEGYVHDELCFNACGALDELCRRGVKSD